MQRNIVIVSIVFASLMLYSCDQSNSKNSPQSTQTTSNSSSVTKETSPNNMVPLVTEEEKRKAEEQHKQATKTDLLKNGPKNDKKYKLYR